MGFIATYFTRKVYAPVRIITRRLTLTFDMGFIFNQVAVHEIRQFRRFCARQRLATGGGFLDGDVDDNDDDDHQQQHHHPPASTFKQRLTFDI